MKHLFTSFGFIFLTGIINAQIQTTKYDTQNSGLPDNDVKCIEMLSNNDLWIATSAGLARFNGINWTVYTTSNSQIPSDVIRDMVVDKNNNVWVATSAGLGFFNGTTWTKYDQTNTTMSFGSPLSIAIDKQDNIWVSEFDLHKFNGSIWEKYYYPKFSLANEICVDNNNKLWAAHSSGYGISGYNITDSTWTEYDSTNCTYLKESITDIGLMHNGNVVVSNLLDPCFMFNGNTWQELKVANIGYDVTVLKDQVVRGSETWLAMSNGFGLAKYNGTTWTFYSSFNPAYIPFSAIRFDSQGNLWAGALDGLYKINASQLVSVNEKNAMATSIKIFPNPASDHVQVLYSAEQLESVFIQVCDVNGKKLKEVSAMASLNLISKKIDVSDLANGNYLIVIESSSSGKVSEPFIISR